MSGAPRDPTTSEHEPLVAESRRLTPSIGIADFEPDTAVHADTANEDFLFHLYRGSELLQDNRVHEAKEELERALDLQPRDAKGQDLLAIVYFRLGLYPRAIAIYEQLRRTSPRDAALMLNLALCYLKTGQPSSARHELVELVKHHPGHSRGWGYLGLACERLGDLEAARDAFDKGGHTQLARRMEAAIAGRIAESMAPAAAGEPPRARDVVAAAFEELDEGELSFAIAEPAREGAARAEPWQSVELGRAMMPGEVVSVLPRTVVPNSEGSLRAALPQLAVPKGSRRPTLIAPAAPAPGAELLEATLERFPSPNPPNLTGASAPAPGVEVAGPPPSVAFPLPGLEPGASGRTLPPVLHRHTAPLPAAAQLARDSIVVFPSEGEVAVHASGVALVRTGAAGFCARTEALRVAATSITSQAVERRMQGRVTSEPLGGVSSPIALFRGSGQLVVGPRPGRKLSSFLLEGEIAFVREDVLLGFDGALTHETARVADAAAEGISMVQLEGKGAVLLEALGDLLGLQVTPQNGLLVRRDAVVAWFGRLVTRAVPPAEAPGGQHGLVAFAGDGSVLFATA